MRPFSPATSDKSVILQRGMDAAITLDDYKENVYSSPSDEFDANEVDAGTPVDWKMDNNSDSSRRSSGLGELTSTSRKRSYDFQGLDGSSDERTRKSVNRGESPIIDIYRDDDDDARHEEGLADGSARQDMGSSVVEDNQDGSISTVFHEAASDSKEEAGRNSNSDDDDDMSDDFQDPMDETHLSTFSAIPDMTTFAQLRESPMNMLGRDDQASPTRQEGLVNNSIGSTIPGAVRETYRTGALLDGSSPVVSPTPRRARDSMRQVETGNLLDFTDQINFTPRQSYSMQNALRSPIRRSPFKVGRPSRSPTKFSLLDFDIPPAPTPRSIPSVTPRELESLKSGFLSEISSLKATLSGKEAEVTSLKQSVADAERRVGEALEAVRTESARRETLEIEQTEWMQRSKEMETVLRNIKADIIDGERERERLKKKAEESEKAKEQLEGKVVELNSQLSAARKSEASGNSGPSGNAPGTKTAEETANEVQDAVERVARELHMLYKSKHETKVAALKKSYEARWEKRVREAESKLKAALAENESLKTELDAASSKAADPNSSMFIQANEEQEAEKRVLEAQIKGLEQELASVKEDSERVRAELKMERAEKGELVAAVDEWLAMQQNQPPAQQEQASQRNSEPSSPQEQKPQESETTATEPEQQPDNNFRRSVSRGGVSGIRPPSGSISNGEKKIPKYGGTPGRPYARTNSGGKSGIAVFTPGRGGIMSSIERMGRGV